MDSDADVARLLRGSPWVFRNSWLVVQPWQRDLDPKDVTFSHVPVWVHILDLPPHCRTSNMARKIGSCLGEVLDSGVFELPDKSIILKVKVHIDISKPIKKGANIGSRTDGVIWVNFRYEKLPQFCFYCGKVGHGEQGCSLSSSDEEGCRSKKLGP